MNSSCGRVHRAANTSPGFVNAQKQARFSVTPPNRRRSIHRQSPADFADGFFRAFLLFGSFILKEAVTAKSAQDVIFHRTCTRMVHSGILQGMMCGKPHNQSPEK
jgi:hypothetical protein